MHFSAFPLITVAISALHTVIQIQFLRILCLKRKFLKRIQEVAVYSMEGVLFTPIE